MGSSKAALPRWWLVANKSDAFATSHRRQGKADEEISATNIEEQVTKTAPLTSSPG
jgi:hypothetical protein